MTFNKVFILSMLFIFCIIPIAGAGEIQSIVSISDFPKTVNRDRNEEALKTNTLLAKVPARRLFKSGETQSNKIQPKSQFLKGITIRNHFRWVESLNHIIFSYGVFPYHWKEKAIIVQSIPGVSLSNPVRPPSSNKSSPIEIKPLAWTDPSASLKLLQPHQAEIFKEIFFGLGFSFEPMSGRISLEMKAAPYSDKEGGVVITF